MNIIEKLIENAFLFGLFVAIVLFFLVCGWLRVKLNSFNRLMVTASPQYDFIKVQIMNYLSDNYKGLMKGIMNIVNNENTEIENVKEDCDKALSDYFTHLYKKLDPIRKTKLGHIKFERALHFCLKTKLISHPLDLIGTRNSAIAERVAVNIRKNRYVKNCMFGPTSLSKLCCWKKGSRQHNQKPHSTVISVVFKCILPLILNLISSGG